MRLLLQYLKNYRKLIFVSLLFAAVNQIFSLLDPILFRQLIDKYATKFDQLDQATFVRGVIFLLFLSGLVALVSRLAKNFQEYYVSTVAQKLGAQLYADSITHSLSLPFQTFEDQRSGEFLQKLNQARDDAQNFMTSMVNIFFISMISVVFVLIYSLMVHWAITVTFAILVPIVGVSMFLVARRLKGIQTSINKEIAGLSGQSTETLRNLEIVKSLGLKEQEVNRLNTSTEKILALQLKKTKMVRGLTFIQGTLINTVRLIMLGIMFYLIFKRAITLGEFFSLMFYSFTIFQPLYELGTLIQQYQTTQVSFSKLQEILNTPVEPLPKNPEKIGAIKTIEFNNVSFQYTSERSALKNISWQIQPGQHIAFVGLSGSGKSTLIKLLIGLYQPSSGSITYNGVKHTQIIPDELRSQIGLVSQDTQLFAGSIEDNLKFVKPQATPEEMIVALRQAQAYSLIERSSDGLHTLIGEGGLKLSGGEKQRLAIARALLRKPRLLIFDEATSSLDSLTEHEITETIKQLHEQIPELMLIQIAHRLSTIVTADTIYVLKQGSIAEQGTHAELRTHHSLYQKLWEQQTLHEELQGDTVLPARA